MSQAKVGVSCETTKLLAETFTASLGDSVVTHEEFLKKKRKCKGNLFPQPLDISKLFELSYVSGPFGDKPADSVVIKVFAKLLSGEIITYHVKPDATVLDFQERISDQTGIPFDQIRLVFNSTYLMDYKATLQDCNVRNESTVHVYKQLTGGGGPLQLLVDSTLLDPSFDYDFSDMSDDGTKYYRGGYLYERPYGWKRYAIKVKDKYKDNLWLGPKGIRVDSAEGEWPVSYHGTARTPAGNIAEVGYDLSKGRRFKYGRGIYSTPSLKVASKYAQEFTSEGKRYQIVLQNRVSSDNLKIVESGDGPYWLQPDEAKIRPYGNMYP